MAKLRKGRQGKLLGVCAGLAEFMDADPTIVRMLVVLSALISCGVTVVMYIAAGLLMPAAE